MKKAIAVALILMGSKVKADSCSSYELNKFGGVQAFDSIPSRIEVSAASYETNWCNPNITVYFDILKSKNPQETSATCQNLTLSSFPTQNLDTCIAQTAVFLKVLTTASILGKKISFNMGGPSVGMAYRIVISN